MSSAVLAKDVASIDWTLTWSLLASLVVMPLATLVLAAFTIVLARETRRMARASERAEITVTIEPNQWGLMYFDIWVANTGNRAAYEIEVHFDPPLLGYEHAETSPPPLRRISVMRPGQTIHSFLGAVEHMSEQRTSAVVSWRVGSASGREESTRYVIDFDFLRNASMLGEDNPLVQIAKEVKRMREDWKSIAHGQKRLQVDGFSSSDREDQRRARDAAFAEFKRKKSGQTGTTPGGDSSAPT